jgi:hypothetical protein
MEQRATRLGLLSFRSIPMRDTLLFGSTSVK